MKVLYNEGLANHVSPESCGDCGNTIAEALTGESTGGALSHEIHFWVPTLFTKEEGNMVNSGNCELLPNPAGSKNLACAEASYAEIGRSGRPPQNKRSYALRMARKRRDSVPTVHNISRKSDNNIVPKRQANKRATRPQRSLRREGR